MNSDTPWQLKMFSKTLKKQQRLRVLSRLLGPIAPADHCLLVTCGDNTGAMNWHLRNLGGRWSWVDLESKSIAEMSEFLGDPVLHGQADRLPLPDDFYDRVLAIDAHEHVPTPEALTGELRRVAKPGAQIIITTPGGDPRQWVNRLKNVLGMTKEKYGHQRDGFSTQELRQLMLAQRLQPRRDVTFSRFFTELAELGINFGYVMKLSRKSAVKVEEGTIAPATSAQLKSVGKAYRLYSLVYPAVWLFSCLDWLISFMPGYVSLVEGVRP